MIRYLLVNVKAPNFYTLTNKTIPVAELVERTVKIDKEFNGRPWNILQILTNMNMIVPLEDRK